MCGCDGVCEAVVGVAAGGCTGVVGEVVVPTGLVALAGAVASVNACTPPWPRQAPLRFVPLKLVPSLQVAVTGLGVWAMTAAQIPVPKARVKRKAFTLSTSNCASIARQFVSWRGTANLIGSDPGHPSRIAPTSQ